MHQNTDKTNEVKDLGDYIRIIVEMDEKNPKTIAIISPREMDCKEGLRIRLTPKYD